MLYAIGKRAPAGTRNESSVLPIDDAQLQNSPQSANRIDCAGRSITIQEEHIFIVLIWIDDEPFTSKQFDECVPEFVGQLLKSLCEPHLLALRYLW